MPLNSLASSLADMGCSDTNAGKKRAKSGFMTSSDAHMIATLTSMVDHVNAKVPDSRHPVSHTIVTLVTIHTRNFPLVRKVMHK
jgi:hypothetical protein